MQQVIMAGPFHATPRSDLTDGRGPAGGELAASSLAIAALGHDWQHLAACRNADLALFYPASRAPADSAAALAMCARCPVTQQCLAQGLVEDRNRVGGIYGGTTEAQRFAGKRAVRAKARVAARALAKAESERAQHA